MDFGRRARKKEAVATVGSWWHSIDLGDGVVTPGAKTPAILADELAGLALPPLTGRTVLDIGAWDGFYSFEAERRGAQRVVALDHFVWSIRLDLLHEYLAERAAQGQPPAPFDDIPHLWDRTGHPGKRGFDVAHEALGSSVESVIGDFVTMDLDRVGTFDVVLYLGVLYHMRHPLLALERLRRVTGDLAVVESQVTFFPGFEHRAFAEFFERDELNNDYTNWWAPNLAGLVAMCRAAGFRTVEVRRRAPLEWDDLPTGHEPIGYRAMVHARV
jgi:tRNA (mo5U34)-methyltransferase